MYHVAPIKKMWFSSDRHVSLLEGMILGGWWLIPQSKNTNIGIEKSTNDLANLWVFSSRIIYMWEVQDLENDRGLPNLPKAYRLYNKYSPRLIYP